MARTLHLTNDQFDVLYDVLDETIINISENIEDTDLELNDYEIYKVWQQMNNLQSPKVSLSDDNYGDKVDTLVEKMVVSNDKEFTHDSEGC